MFHVASWRFKVVYVVVVVSVILPISFFPWGSPFGMIPLAPLAFFVLGAYRIWLVVRQPRSLDYYRTAGASHFLRTVGTAALYVGAIVAVLARPLMMLGLQFHLGGYLFLLLAYVSASGPIGLVLFEFSRLLAFEAEAVREHT